MKKIAIYMILLLSTLNIVNGKIKVGSGLQLGMHASSIGVDTLIKGVPSSNLLRSDVTRSLKTGVEINANLVQRNSIEVVEELVWQGAAYIIVDGDIINLILSIDGNSNNLEVTAAPPNWIIADDGKSIRVENKNKRIVVSIFSNEDPKGQLHQGGIKVEKHNL